MGRSGEEGRSLSVSRPVVQTTYVSVRNPYVLWSKVKKGSYVSEMYTKISKKGVNENHFFRLEK